jgi:uncharacterized protein YsxB (DUF464 family)
MILIKKEDNIITISGHALYSESNDIVCASVSSIMYTTVNACLNFDDKSIEFIDDSNKVTIVNKKRDEITNKLLLNMMKLFLELSSKYPKNIRVESEE